MANMDGLRNSPGRISPFAYQNGPRTHTSPILHGLLDIDSDIPLDAFDQELLAECQAEPPEPIDCDQSRMSLHSRTIHAPLRQADITRRFKDDLHGTPFSPRESSSSSAVIASSPTVAALKNCYNLNSFGTSRSYSPKTGGAGRFKEHAGAVVTADTASRSQSSKGRSNTSHDSHTTGTARPRGNTTRMGLGHAPPIIQGIPLISATELPDRCRSIFSFPVFNAVQSKCFSIAFGSNDNLVVSAPTGSGKTAIMELAICRLLTKGKAEDFKVVYQAPTKSLCAERMRDWSAKFGPLDLSCAELTGDTEQSQLKNVQSASIIITTPEKWDSVTRKWKDNAKLMKMVKLFLIDEVHILKETRGATLEAVVSRMKSVGSDVRFVALSATVPNSDDIAIWLGKAPDAQYLPAHREVFGEGFRPVKLEKHVYSIRGPPNDFAFDKVLNDHVKEAITRHSQKKPTMIFCTTRKMAADTAKMLSNNFVAAQRSYRLWHAPKNTYHMTDEELTRLVSTGVAFHHGGVDAADRKNIEEGFLSSDISVICCTSTLAVGVNLPCYLVIIKGTVTWTDKGAQEYPDLEVMQMLGRAGRPQFESSACAVILTRPEKEQHYKKMVSGEEILESCLHLNLIDHLNSEIGLGAVTDMMSAKNWLASTFMFVRLQKNPRHYQLKEGVDQEADEDLLGNICAKNINLLQDARLITDVSRIKCTEFGDAMARYYIKFDTMKTILAMAPKAKMSEIISTIAQASEFSDIRFKSGEKGLYKELNGDVGIKFPVKVDIAQHPHKVSLLIQSELGGNIFPNHDKWKKHKAQFTIDRNLVFSHVNRLIRCLIDCQLQLQDVVAVRHALELARSLAARVWDNSPFQMKQIEGIGDVAVRKLAQAGVKSIEILQNTEPHRIENVIGRLPPFGHKVLAKAIEFPSLHVSVKQMGEECKPRDWATVKFKAEVGFVNEKVPTWFRKRIIYICFLAETSDGQLIDFRRFSAKKLENGQEILLSVRLTQPTSSISCRVMCDEIAGTCRHVELKLESFPASCFSAAKPVVLESEKTRPLKTPPSAVSQDFFDYGDLDNADLLAALDSEEGIEIIHDIDQIVEEPKLPAKTSLKRSASKGTDDQDCQPATFREPFRLESGRWTCQHVCKEQGKTCKHPCCAEGVENPAKPGRKKAKKDVSRPNVKEDTMSEVPAKSIPSNKTLLQSELKKQKSFQASNSDVYRSSTGVGLSTAMNVPSEVRDSYEKATTSKLSFMQDRSGCFKDVSNFAENCGNAPVKGACQAYRSTAEETFADFVDVFDLEMEELDRLTADSSVKALPKNHLMQGSGPDLSDPYEGHGTTPIMIEAAEDPAQSILKPIFRADELSRKLAYGAIDSSSMVHLVSATNRRGDAKASISRVQPAPADNNRENIAGGSSSNGKNLHIAPKADEDAEEYGDLAVEAFFAQMEAVDRNPRSPPARAQKLDHGCHMPLPSSQAVPDLQSSIARTPPPPNDHTRLRQDADVQVNNIPELAVLGKETTESMTEEEMQKQLAKEEQRRKWEGFEDFYEEYGQFVEIVD